ncbi:hypothetical protein EST38_g7853 [Candolleomyces aberdarensis]|uniref:Nephrocystin 3-like N-terminal domain-containing protein n=1 Tax=Candolleomyces aberdarensis TaxID=2316362 RepID=A0A4Q2DHH1_9AGAR|nr:hypothetical protein EST38_g7853 [Candolleomyces aberdarensis]
MAEAIGTASAIAGLLTLAGQIAKFSYTYLSDFQNATKSQRSYLLEISALSDVLLQVESILENEDRTFLSSVASQLSAMVEKCRKELEDLKNELETRVVKEYGKFKRFQSDVVWPFKEKEIKSHIDSVHRFRNLIANIISLNTHSISVGTHQKIDGLRKEHEKRQITEWLGLSDSCSSATALEDEACPETLEWFLASPEYLTLKNDQPSLLWCHGKPGVGKTTLSAVAFNNLQEEFGDGLILHHFCDFSERNQQTSSAVVKALLHQVLSQANDDQIVKLRKHREKPKAVLKLATLTSILIDVCPSHSTFLVLDGLDEFDDRKNLCPVLKQLVQAGWHVLATSRALPDIADAFQNYPSIEIATAKSDLETYVAHRLTESDFDTISGNKSILAAIVDKADGIFLLARLIMDRLLELTTVKEMRRFLEHMPSTVHDGYLSSLNRILALPPSRSSLALRAIGWITHSERRLQVTEVLHAFAFEEGSAEVDEDNIPSLKLVLQVCVGIVSADTETETLGLIHSTAHEFFRQLPQLQDTHLDIASTSIGYLSLPPLSTLCPDLEALSRRFRDTPFLAYAAKYWGMHVKHVEEQVASRIRALLLNEGVVAASFQALQVGEWKNQELAAAVFASLPCRQSPLHIAAYWGLDFTLKSLLSMGGDATTKDSDGWTPLHWAASNGHGSTVAILIDHGVDVNSRDLKGWTPLFWACFRGLPNIVSCLLEKGADHRVRSVTGWTCLHWAISRRHNEIITILLQHHKDFSLRATSITVPIGTLTIMRLKEIQTAKAYAVERTVDDETPLELAASAEDGDVFKMLLQDFDPANKQPAAFYEEHLNTWWSTQRFDHPPIDNVWRVLNKADLVLGQDYYLRSPLDAQVTDWKTRLLHVAIKDDKLHVAQMLLELGANPNTPCGPNEWTAIHVAAFRQDPCFVELILKWSKNCISLQDKKRKTALHLAVLNGFESLVKILLEHGADVNGQDWRGNTPLLIACGFPSYLDASHLNKEDPIQFLPLRIVQILLQHGADISVKNRDGQTAVRCAIASDATTEVVQTLIKAGADISSLDDEGTSAIEQYVGRPWNDSDEGLLDLLLKQSGEDRTATLPLLALQERQWGNFRCLRNRGIHPRKSDLVGNTAVAFGAFDDGEIDILRQVLKEGAVLQFDDHYPDAVSRLLYKFQRNGNFDTVAASFAILQDTNPQMTTPERLTKALHQTLQYSRSDQLLQLLIDNGADVYHGDGDQMDAFLLCAVHGYWESLPCLFRAHSSRPPPPDHWLSSLAEPIHTLDSDQPTALIRALKLANKLECPAWVKSKMTPLHQAIRRGDMRTVEVILAMGSDRDINAGDEYGWTLLHYAVCHGREDLVDLLLDSGANVGARTSKWSREWGRHSYLYQGNDWVGQPLHLAAMFFMKEIVGKLLKAGADVNAKSIEIKDSDSRVPRQGPTALHLVLSTGRTLDDNRLSIAQMLVDSGAAIEGVVDHLDLPDVLRFGAWEALWDKLRVGITQSARTTTIVMDDN